MGRARPQAPRVMGPGPAGEQVPGPAAGQARPAAHSGKAPLAARRSPDAPDAPDARLPSLPTLQ